MNNYEKIESLINKQGIITTKEVEENSIPRWFLSEMVKKGKLEKVSRGIYINENGIYDEYYIFQTHHKSSFFSYSNALYFHSLTEKTPSKIEVTVYQGYNTHRFNKNITVHYVKKEIHRLGVTEIISPFGNRINVYDMERCMCDLVKGRKIIESEVFKKAFQMYVKREDKSLKKLFRYAELMGIESDMYNIMEVLS